MSDDERTFMDTNILVYAYDRDAPPEKRETCKKLVTECFRGERDFYISNQVLAEFCSVLLGKVQKPLTKAEVAQIISEINTVPNWRKISYRTKTVEKALACNAPFWDSLIAETMKEKSIHSLYTENTKDFSKVEGVTATNPME